MPTNGLLIKQNVLRNPIIDIVFSNGNDNKNKYSPIKTFLSINLHIKSHAYNSRFVATKQTYSIAFYDLFSNFLLGR